MGLIVIFRADKSLRVLTIKADDSLSLSLNSVCAQVDEKRGRENAVDIKSELLKEEKEEEDKREQRLYYHFTNTVNTDVIAPRQ